jgi:hypothetical protein
MAEDNADIRREFHSCLTLAFVLPEQEEGVLLILKTAVSDVMRPFRDKLREVVTSVRH